MHHKPACHVKINLPYNVAAVSDEFLGQLVSELDPVNSHVTLSQ